MEKEYAQAIATMSRQSGRDQAALADGLIAHLRKTGRSKMLPGILRELSSAKERQEKLAPVLEVATQGEEAAAKAFLAKEGVEVENVTVNPSLIRGWRARANGLLWDRSAKRVLTDIYKKITN
jgi:F0F1-type ATP synthase delta subunit